MVNCTVLSEIEDFLSLGTVTMTTISYKITFSGWHQRRCPNWSCWWTVVPETLIWLNPRSRVKVTEMDTLDLFNKQKTHIDHLTRIPTLDTVSQRPLVRFIQSPQLVWRIVDIRLTLPSGSLDTSSPMSTVGTCTLSSSLIRILSLVRTQNLFTQSL